MYTLASRSSKGYVCIGVMHICTQMNGHFCPTRVRGKWWKSSIFGYFVYEDEKCTTLALPIGQRMSQMAVLAPQISACFRRRSLR